MITATMTLPPLEAVPNLTRVNWMLKGLQQSSFPSQFCPRYIRMQSEATGDIGQKAPPMLVNMIHKDKISYAYIDVNF